MERACKIILRVFSVLLFSLSAQAETDFIIDWPDDIPTIEALIDAHKAMAKAEDRAIKEITLITGEQSLTEKATAAYNKTRTVLNKRLSDAMSYIQLATTVINVSTKLEYLIEEYKEYTTNTFQYTVKKPYVLIYYTRANLQLKKEIAHLKEMVLSYTTAELNILKATMEEKFQLLTRIELSIANMRRIIDHNDLVCRSIMRTGFKMYYVKDMFNIMTKELQTEKLISRWIKEN